MFGIAARMMTPHTVGSGKESSPQSILLWTALKVVLTKLTDTTEPSTGKGKADFEGSVRAARVLERNTDLCPTGAVFWTLRETDPFTPGPSTPQAAARVKHCKKMRR